MMDIVYYDLGYNEFRKIIHNIPTLRLVKFLILIDQELKSREYNYGNKTQTS